MSRLKAADIIGLVLGLAVRIDMALNPNPVPGDPEDLQFWSR